MNQTINNHLTDDIQSKRPIRAQIFGVGSYLPNQKVSSLEMMQEIDTEKQYDLPYSWMSDSMGIDERRMVSSDQKPSDLAIAAAEKALASYPDLNPDFIDAVIFCGIERDKPEPATAHIVQNALGLNANLSFDVANACFGFIQSLTLASNLIETGAIRYALIATGEVSTKVSRVLVDQLKKGIAKEEAKHLWGILSVGDAGGAIILGPSTNNHSGFFKFGQKSQSQYEKLCHYQWTSKDSVEAHMDMGKIYARGFRLNKRVLTETLDEINWQSSLDWAVCHQTGKTSYDDGVRELGLINEKVIKTYPNLGNITTATMPLSYEKLLEKKDLKEGDRLGGLFSGSGLVAGQFAYII